MREFGPIDREVEARAMKTIFFTDSVFEGQACRLSVVNYLAFLSLRGAEIAQEVVKLRQAFSAPSRAHFEHDLALLFRARNWRFHNIACVALACAGPSDQLLAELWSCIRIGSWTSPQLAATAAYVDSGFDSKAMALVEDHRTYYKSIVGLATLLSERQTMRPALSAAANANIAEATQIDRDNLGQIAVAWHKNLSEALNAT
jgi:hypothetical protein